MKVLICLDGRDIPGVLAVVDKMLSPDAEWLLLHVSDTGPLEEVGRAIGGLLGRGPRRERAERRLEHTSERGQEEIRAEITGWLQKNSRTAEVIMTRGRPEQVILRVAEERQVNLVALGVGRGPEQGPGPTPLAPVARFVVDHARRNILLLRR